MADKSNGKPKKGEGEEKKASSQAEDSAAGAFSTQAAEAALAAFEAAHQGGPPKKNEGSVATGEGTAREHAAGEAAGDDPENDASATDPPAAGESSDPPKTGSSDAQPQSKDQAKTKSQALQETSAGDRPDAEEGPVPVVVFDQVTKTYAAGTPKAFTAIKDVTFTVEDLPDKGEFICLLGPSGCGKSTVLRLIAGLEPQHPPSRGRVEVFGKTVTGPGADRGMVFQAYTSFDNRTVLQNVAFGLECRGVPTKERLELARDWIAKVGLSVKNDSDKFPHQLSGGMQQRVAIARTLILRPRIILMDEPFGALDPVTRTQMQDLVVDLWRDVEATVFFVTHSIEEAVYLADRAYLFSNSPGTILQEFAVPPPDLPALQMQRDPEFQEVVYELRDLIDRLEHEQKQESAPPTGE